MKVPPPHSKLAEKLRFGRTETHIFKSIIKMWIIGRERSLASALLMPVVFTLCIFFQFSNYQSLAGGRLNISQLLVLITEILIGVVMLGFIVIVSLSIYINTEVWGVQKNKAWDLSLKSASLINEYYSYIVHPLNIICFGRMTGTTAYEISFRIGMMIFSTLIAYFTLFIGRNKIPCDNPIIVISRKKELLFFTYSYIHLTIRTTIPSIFQHEITEELEDIIMLIVWVLMINFQIYWSLIFNQVVVSFYGVVLATKFSLGSYSYLKDDQYGQIIMMLVLVTVVIRTSCKVLGMWAFFDFLQEDISQEKLFFAVVTYEELSVRYYKDFNNLNMYSKKLFLHYEGILFLHMHNCYNLNCYCMKRRDEEPIRRFLLSLVKERYSKKQRHGELLLLLQLNDLFYTMTTFRGYLVKKKSAMMNLQQRLSLFHFKQLFEGLISCVIDEKTSSNVLTEKLTDVYHDLSDAVDMESNPSSPNVGQILQLKNSYLSMIDLLILVIRETQSIFTKVTLGKKSNVNDLYYSNKRIIAINSSIKRRLFSILDNYYLALPTYYLISLAMYFSNVRNEVKLAQKLFTLYKQKLQKWNILRGSINELDHENMVVDSVVIRASIEKGNRGLILDYSPDYYTYLGECGLKSLKGLNVNDVLPDPFQELHTQKMARIDNFHLLMNLTRKFYIKGFDGFLRAITFVVKAHTSLDCDVSAYLFMRVDSLDKKCIVLTDTDGKIFLGSKTFWDIIDINKRPGTDVTELSHISGEIGFDLRVLQGLRSEIDLHLNSFLQLDMVEAAERVNQFLKEKKKKNQAIANTMNVLPDSVKKYANKLGMAIDPELEQQEKTYHIDPSSPLFSEMGNSTVKANVKTYRFYDINYFQVNIEFDQVFYEGLDDSSKSKSSDSILESQNGPHSRFNPHSPSNFGNLKIPNLIGSERPKQGQKIEIKQPITQRLELNLNKSIEEFPLGEEDHHFDDLLRSTGRDRRTTFQNPPTRTALTKKKDLNTPKFSSDINNLIIPIPEIESESQSNGQGKRVFFADIESDKESNNISIQEGNHFDLQKVVPSSNSFKRLSIRQSTKLKRKLNLESLIKATKRGSNHFSSIVKIKTAIEREKKRMIQRDKDSVSVVLASSGHIAGILRNVDQQINILFNKNNLAKMKADASVAGSVADFYKINMNMLIDGVLTHPKKNAIFTALLINLVFYTLTFISSVSFYNFRLKYYNDGVSSLDDFNDGIMRNDAFSKANLLEIFELLALQNDKQNENLDIWGGHDNALASLRGKQEESITKYNQQLEIMYGIVYQNASYFESINRLLIDFLFVDRHPIRFRDSVKDDFNSFEVSFLQLGARQFDFLTKIASVNWSPSEIVPTDKELLNRVMYNTPDTVFSIVDRFLDITESVFIDDLLKNYTLEYYLFMVIYLICILLIYLGFLVVLKIFNNKLLFALTAYGEMKEDEIHMQKVAFQRYEECLQTHKFHEKKILGTYSENAEILAEIKTGFVKKAKKSGKVLSGKLGNLTHGTFPSVIRMVVFGTLLLFIFAILIIFLVVNDGFFKKDLKLMDLTRLAANEFRKHHNFYFSTLMNIMFSTKFNVSELAVNVDFLTTGYRREINYFYAFSSNDKDLESLLGATSYARLNFLNRENICDEYKEVLGEFEGRVCSELNSKIVEKGILSYLYYEDEYIKKLQNRVIEYRKALPIDELWNMDSGIIDMKAIREFWWESEFVEIRIAHIYLIPYYFSQLLSLIHETQLELQSGIGSFLIIFFVGFIGIVLLMLVTFVATTVTLVMTDHKVVLETFRIIHPKTLLSNAYVLNRFKSFFPANMIKLN